MDSTEVKFRLDVFEGPLDLLLHLIKTNELEISEISISKITSQYLSYLRLMESMDLEVAGNYLVMAATLINIKLRSLLPSPEEEIEEEGEDLDDFMSARMLMQRLIEYRQFKEAARELGRHAERQSQIFMREVALPNLARSQEDTELKGDLDLLLAAFARVIRFVDRRDYHEVQSEEFTIEEKIDLLRRRVLIEERIHLTEMFRRCVNKMEMIVTLMAVLEMCRLKELRVVQGESFDDVLLLPRRGDDAAAREELDEQARRAAQEEAEIVASRTGIVDDGVLPDETDDEIDAIVEGQAAPPENGAPAADEGADAAVHETEETVEGGARIIDISAPAPETDPEDED